MNGSLHEIWGCFLSSLFASMNWQLLLLLHFYSVSAGKFTTQKFKNDFPQLSIVCYVIHVLLLYDIVQLIERHISWNISILIASLIMCFIPRREALSEVFPLSILRVDKPAGVCGSYGGW